jgi:hypothetical protein
MILTHTKVIVPMKSAGVSVVRPLTVFGYDDAPHGHAEVSFCSSMHSISLNFFRKYDDAMSSYKSPARISSPRAFIFLIVRSPRDFLQGDILRRVCPHL